MGGPSRSAAVLAFWAAYRDAAGLGHDRYDVVAMGDSITDGTGSTPDANDRWPDFLAERLAAQYGAAAPAVLNVGIAGNRVLSHNAGLGLLKRAGLDVSGGDQLSDPNALFGPSGLSRFDYDVLLQPGVSHVVVLEGITNRGATPRA